MRHYRLADGGWRADHLREIGSPSRAAGVDLLLVRRKAAEEVVSEAVRLVRRISEEIGELCTHAAEDLVRGETYLTDTIGSGGWTSWQVVCSACGKTITRGDS